MENLQDLFIFYSFEKDFAIFSWHFGPKLTVMRLSCLGSFNLIGLFPF